MFAWHSHKALGFRVAGLECRAAATRRATATKA